MKKQSNTIPLILLVAIFILIAIISEQWFFRIDITKDGQYSLSKTTKNILKQQDQPITITAYFTKDLAPDLQNIKNDFKDMLIEYNRLSRGKVVYKFVNPNKDKQSEQEALKAGIQPFLFNAREKDQVKQQRVFMGAKIQKGTASEVIPFVNPKSSIEYALSTAIKKLSIKNKPLIGFVQGQGEPGLNAFPSVLKELDVLYRVKPVKLTDSLKNIYDYKTLVIDAAKDSFNLKQLGMLDDYLKHGGNLFIAMNRVEGNFKTAMGSAINTGLEKWLSKKGLHVSPEFVVDARCNTVGLTQQNGGFTMTTQIRFPYLPIITHFAEHPITKGLEEVAMQFASPITYSGDSSRHFIPLAFSSKLSGKLKAPLFFNVNKRWTKNDFPDHALVVAGVLENNQKTHTGKIVMISDGDFAQNAGPNGQQRAITPDNVNFMVNAVDWLSDDTGLIELRTKTITARPLKQVSENTKLFLKWLNFLLPVLLVIIYGLFRAQHNRNQRLKRMEEDYVK